MTQYKYINELSYLYQWFMQNLCLEIGFVVVSRIIMPTFICFLFIMNPDWQYPSKSYVETQPINSFHIETNSFFCSVNQWTGLYMVETSVLKVLNSKFNMSKTQQHSNYSNSSQCSPLYKYYPPLCSNRCRYQILFKTKDRIEQVNLVIMNFHIYFFSRIYLLE